MVMNLRGPEIAGILSTSRRGTEVKVLCYKSEGRWFDALSKITANFCDGHAGRRIRPNIAGPTLGTILRSYDHDPT